MSKLVVILLPYFQRILVWIIVLPDSVFHKYGNCSHPQISAKKNVDEVAMSMCAAQHSSPSEGGEVSDCALQSKMLPPDFLISSKSASITVLQARDEDSPARFALNLE